MDSNITREEAWNLLRRYNQDHFHLQHALTLEGVMRWYARELGCGDEEFWGQVGLLHDIDFEQYPEQHCLVAPRLLREAGVSEELIHAVVSHGYGLVENEVKPELLMEKVLFAVDELTGLIGAAALMRPSKSVQDMEVKSLRKKFKSVSFAAGCSRDVIRQGAEMLGWDLTELFQKTILAMRSCETSIQEALREV